MIQKLFLNQNTLYIKTLCVPNGFLGLKSVYLDTKNMSLLHIVTKIKAFEEMVGHFGGHLEKWPPRSPGGAADLGPYLKIISRGCFICVPSVMLLTQSARFYQKWPQ